MDDSIKEQSKRSVESYIARDIEKKSDWEKRDKRQVSSDGNPDYPMAVPQTDSESAKGTQKRDKRQVSSDGNPDYPMPVPQTDSEAAKGTPEARPCPIIKILSRF